MAGVFGSGGWAVVRGEVVGAVEAGVEGVEGVGVEAEWVVMGGSFRWGWGGVMGGFCLVVWLGSGRVSRRIWGLFMVFVW